MRRPQEQFVDRQVQVVFTSGTLTGVLEAVGEDGSLFIRQGRTAIWVPLQQVKYVTPLEDRAPSED